MGRRETVGPEKGKGFDNKGGGKGKGHFACFNCGEQGHYSRDCRKPKEKVYWLQGTAGDEDNMRCLASVRAKVSKASNEEEESENEKITWNVVAGKKKIRGNKLIKSIC